MPFGRPMVSCRVWATLLTLLALILVTSCAPADEGGQRQRTATSAGEAAPRDAIRTLAGEAELASAIEAATSGVSDGLKLALNVGAMLIGFIALIAVLAAGCGNDSTSTTASPSTTLPTTTVAPSESDGDGAGLVAQDGDSVAVHYVGTLDDGSEFDNSRGREPLTFVVGSDQVIKGFDDAVRGMAIGEVTTVRIPPQEAYGEVDPELIFSVPIDQAPDDVAVGDEVLIGGQQHGRPALQLGHLVDDRCVDHDVVTAAVHVKDVLEEAKRHLGDAAVEVGHAAVEDSDDIDDRRGEGAIEPAAEQRQFVAHADEALYAAKHGGRNRVCVQPEK